MRGGQLARLRSLSTYHERARRRKRWPGPIVLSRRIDWLGAPQRSRRRLHSRACLSPACAGSDALTRLTRAVDSFRLLLVVPSLAVGLWAGARGSVAGRLAAMGGLACLCYLYAFFVSAVAINSMTLAARL